MPPMQRTRGEARVTSRPSNQTEPASGCNRPVIRLNNVDLPAPFGPMMPSASPRATSRLTPSTALSEPNDLVKLANLRITQPPRRESRPGDRALHQSHPAGVWPLEIPPTLRRSAPCDRRLEFPERSCCRL